MFYSSTMTKDLMNYEQMTQLALRGVVRDAIRLIIREDGLPGAHHFYITFLTRYPGVEIDQSLATKYPDEITIVIEHQYWDLNAYTEEFEVTLKFGGVPKYLKVPYTAVTRFHDPSVGFALQFDTPPEMEPAPPTLAHIKPAETDEPPKEAAAPKKAVKAKTKAKAKKNDDTPDDDGEGPDKKGEKVVSLDAFRKK